MLLESVLQPGPHAVVSAVSQYESLVLRVVTVRKELRVESFASVQALRPEFHTLLGHVKRIVAHCADFAVLIKDQVPVVVIQFDAALVFNAGILDFPVDRVFEGQLTGFADRVVADGQHTVLRVPEILRVRYNGHQRQRVKRVDEKSTGNRIAGFHRSTRKSPGPDHGGEVHLQPFPVVRCGVLRRSRPVCRVEYLRSFGNADRQVLRGSVLPRSNTEYRRFCVSGKTVPVLCEGSRGIIIKKAGQSKGRPAVGNVGFHFGKNHLVQHPSRRIR